MLAGIMSVWGALGGSEIDYRAPEERPKKEAVTQEGQENLKLNTSVPPDKISQDLSMLRGSFDRLLHLLQAHEPLSPSEIQSFRGQKRFG